MHKKILLVRSPDLHANTCYGDLLSNLWKQSIFNNLWHDLCSLECQLHDNYSLFTTKSWKLGQLKWLNNKQPLKMLQFGWLPGERAKIRSFCILRGKGLLLWLCGHHTKSFMIYLWSDPSWKCIHSLNTFLCVIVNDKSLALWSSINRIWGTQKNKFFNGYSQ